jgi:predicted anti-sigma-YlaC factor YlaD
MALRAVAIACAPIRLHFERFLCTMRGQAIPLMNTTAHSTASGLAATAALALALSGCSIERLAIRRLGDALAGSGATFASDDDPELVRAAVPFSLKLIESLLADSPEHEGLLLAADSGFTQYSFAFVEEDADELAQRDLKGAEVLRQRARRLYARARQYGLRGLECRQKGFGAALRVDPRTAVGALTLADVPFAYWTAAAWGRWISLSKDNPDAIADQGIVEALIDRALELDEGFGDGAIHSFLISYEMVRQGAPGEAAERARAHFERAMELSSGREAGPLVALAEAVAVQKQDVRGFKALLEKALSIDVDAWPPSRLANLVMQRRARWLLSCTTDLFVEPDAAVEESKP